MIKMLLFTFMYRRMHSSKLDHLRQITFLRPLFYKCSVGIWTLNNHPTEKCLQHILNILYSTCRLTCCGENPCSTTTCTTSVFGLDIDFFVQQYTTYFSCTFYKQFRDLEMTKLKFEDIKVIDWVKAPNAWHESALPLLVRNVPLYRYRFFEKFSKRLWPPPLHFEHF